MKIQKYTQLLNFENPMDYLINFFTHEYEIETWIKESRCWIHASLNTSIYDISKLEIGFIYLKIRQHLDIAYQIVEQCRIQTFDQKHVLEQFSIQDAIYKRFKSQDASPEDQLKSFFSYQSIDSWHITLDKMLTEITMISTIRNYGDNFGDRTLIIQELLIRLLSTLVVIFENKGLKCKVPTYFIASYPESKTSEMIVQQPCIRYI